RADGKALAAGDSLGWLADGARPRTLPMPSERIMDCAGEARLELILGAQIGDFPAMSLFDAFNGDWQVDTRADRMGVRLLGPRLECRQQSMISEGIALGAVQVPPDGQPIVLLNDRQTIGGYPRLGALAPLALARLAQCLPGQRVRLLPTVQEAAHREHRRLLAAWDA
ncbi:allophanate hydrolase, partial [Pseudomonas aeruginosa]